MQAKWAVSSSLVLVLSACGGLQQQTADLSQMLAADPAAKTDADELLGASLNPGDAEVAEALIGEITTSIRDFSDADLASFTSSHGRSPADQVELLGLLLGRLRNGCEDRKAGSGLLSLREVIAPGDDETSCQSVMDDVIYEVNASLPNEPSDNPAMPGSQTLRSSFQTAIVLASQTN